MKAISLNVANIPGTELCVGSKEPTVVDMVHRFSNLGACSSCLSQQFVGQASGFCRAEGIPETEETSRGPDPELASTEAQNIKNERPPVSTIRTLYGLLCLSSCCRCSLDQGASARCCLYVDLELPHI